MDLKNESKLLRLRNTFDKNYKITRLYANYLEKAPTFISRDMIDELCSDGALDIKSAITALVCEIIGLDFENPLDRELMRDYVAPSVRILDSRRYTEDAYYKNVKIQNKTVGSWEFRREAYPAFRAVICDDLAVTKDFTEIPPLGFFTEDFEFPAVLEGGNEWMTLTPIDMDTCRHAIEAARGRVATFGLGLGYYAYHAARKREVESVTVIERSVEVIKLFTEQILPQMECRDKIKIVCDDAFDYAKRVMPKENFDLAFVDIWRDGGDGAVAYKKMKPLEAFSKNTEFLYWIESFILSRLRAERFEELWEAARSGKLSFDTVNSELTDKLRLAGIND